MTRDEFESCVLENYNASCDRPWARHPGYQVFRHPENGKWFALAADIPKSALNGGSDELAVVPDETVKLLLEMSFDATKEKKRASR